MINNEIAKKKVFVETFGCQMNVYDSEVASGLLEQAGFELVGNGEAPHLTPNASSTAREAIGAPLRADIFLMNTCSVREHAEQKVYSRLGALGKIKKTNPNMIIGLMGCMVEEHKEKLFKRFPALDLMVGTRNIKELPALIEEVRRTRRQTSRIKQDGISIEYTDLIKRDSSFHAWLPIMTGCDKVCTYYIVPITRGAEVSMPAREVYREASRLVEEGVQWITLLGQNVNSYNGSGVIPAKAGIQEFGSPTKTFGDDKNDIKFPELLEMLCEIEGLKRISFTTSHPHDATEDLFKVIAKNPKISRRFHLPLQSGSNKILKRMKRLHTYDEYKAKIDRLRELVPDIAITTDIIAGFSGETDEDHEATMKALSEIKYDSAYIYKYSVRQQTPAAKLPDDVPLEIKEKRNDELLSLQKKIIQEVSQKWLGRTVNVFVEEESTKTPGCVLGRTDQDRKVVFEGGPDLIGQFISVRLQELHFETFRGKLI